MGGVPTYVWKCSHCPAVEERFERMTGQPRARKCPACGRMTFERQIGMGCARSGTVVPGLRVSYPLYDPQLPVPPGCKSHEELKRACTVNSQQDHRNKFAAAGFRMERG